MNHETLEPHFGGNYLGIVCDDFRGWVSVNLTRLHLSHLATCEPNTVGVVTRFYRRLSTTTTRKLTAFLEQESFPW